MLQYGAQLVNWANFGREIDYPAFERQRRLRDANMLLVAETRNLEEKDLALAVERYRQAIKAQREYEAIAFERGLAGELAAEIRIPDVKILDRLTLCLVKLGRAKEARQEAETFFAESPRARDTAMSKRIMQRVTKDRAAPRPKRPRPAPAGATPPPLRTTLPPLPSNVVVPADVVGRNLLAIDLEGVEEDLAIKIYEANVRAGFDGSHPYARLAIIYRRRGLLHEEVRVLERAVEVFERLRGSPRSDVAPKLAEFMRRLDKARRLAARRRPPPQA